MRKCSILITVNYRFQVAVVSAKSKLSTSTMGYIAGIFQFAGATKTLLAEIITNIYQYQPHEKSRNQRSY
jgi:hypothetical protein